MTRVTLRSLAAAVIVGTMCVAAGTQPGAAGTDSPIDHFVAMAPNVSDPQSAGHVDIYVERWSTDRERDDLAAALAGDDPGTLLQAVQKMRLRRAGVLLTPGIGGGLGARVRTRRARNLLFARRIETPTGQQVILATDRALAFGEPEMAWPSNPAFTLVDIRFDRNGEGTGKVASPRQVVLNTSTGTLEVGEYASHPVRLSNVRPERVTRIPMPRPRSTASFVLHTPDKSLR